MTPQEAQAAYREKVYKELDTMQMSWSNDLKEWYPSAIRSLDYSSLQTLGVAQDEYGKLFEQGSHGINMNVMGCLLDNMARVTPQQMGCTAQGWAGVIAINDRLVSAWHVMAGPVQQTARKSVEIMQNKPSTKLQIVN